MPLFLDTYAEAAAKAPVQEAEQSQTTTPTSDAGDTTAVLDTAIPKTPDADEKEPASSENSANGNTAEVATGSEILETTDATPAFDPAEVETLRKEHAELLKFKKLQDSGIDPDEALKLYDQRKAESFDTEMQRASQERARLIESRQDALVSNQVNEEKSKIDLNIKAQLRAEGYTSDEIYEAGSSANSEYWSRFNNAIAPIEQNAKDQAKQLTYLQKQLTEVAMTAAFKEIDQLAETKFPHADVDLVKKMFAFQAPTTEAETTALRGAIQQALSDFNQVGLKASSKVSAGLALAKTEIASIKATHAKALSDAREQGRLDALNGRASAIDTAPPSGKGTQSAAPPKAQARIAQYVPYGY